MRMFHEHISVLNTDTSTANVELYSLSNSFLFCNFMTYRAENMYVFWRPAILRSKCQENSGHVETKIVTRGKGKI
jgi:hypothetical protein